MAIDSFGKIILCPLLGNIQLGTITDGIENIWENSKILMEYRSHTIADIEKCNTCKNVNVSFLTYHEKSMHFV